MRGTRRWLLIWPLAVAVTVAAQWPWLNLHDDVRFTLGPLRAAQPYAGPLDTFVHRPMANRLLMSGLDWLAFGPAPPTPSTLREKVILSWAVVAVGAAALLVHLALLRRTTPLTATATALAVFASLAWASEAYVLQPEWTATVLALAGLGAALLSGPGGSSRPWVASVWLAVAAGLLAVAVLQKYTTVTAAALALLALWAFDRRRAVLLAGVSGGSTAALLLLSFAVGEHEWQWFTETSRLNPAAGLRWDAFGEWAVNWAWNNPIVLAWPAAAALAARLTGRRVWVWGSIVGFGIALVVIMVQNQFFGYHGTPLLPVAAAVATFAAVRWTERTGSVSWGLIPLAAWVAVSYVLYREPILWRYAYRDALAGWLLLVIMVIALAVWAQASRRSLSLSTRALSPSTSSGESLSKGPVTVTSLLLTVALTFPGWPGTPYGFFGQDRSRRSEVERQAELIMDGQRVREAVGSESVVYLADGETVYVVGNRTACRYPASVVLYRSTIAGVSDLRSFADNLACLSDPSAQYLVLQTWRVPFGDLDPRVGETVRRLYDCDRETRVRELLVCPRR